MRIAIVEDESALAEELELPVFDTISAANLLEYGVHPPRY